MNNILYVEGDATAPVKKPAMIVHVCNDVGAWGAGFVLALSRRWSRPEEAYRAMNPEDRQLGRVQFVWVEPRIVVANMIAQAGIGYTDGPPIRYDALEDCLAQVAAYARTTNLSIHMPRIGCGIGGGRWEEVEPILLWTLEGLDVVVYDLPGRPQTAFRALDVS